MDELKEILIVLILWGTKTKSNVDFENHLHRLNQFNIYDLQDKAAEIFGREYLITYNLPYYKKQPTLF